MIVLKVELWPLGVEAAKRELGRAFIVNDGSGDRETGHYTVSVNRKGQTRVPSSIVPKGPRPFREGRVGPYPRLRYSVWRLVLRSLMSCFPEERS